jgi:hypothetical protein
MAVNRSDIYGLMTSVREITWAFTSAAKSLHEIALAMSPDYKARYQYQQDQLGNRFAQESRERKEELKTDGS